MEFDSLAARSVQRYPHIKGRLSAKTALENMHRVSMMGYGLYSDFVEELPPRETFYGGHGVVTYNGLYKPGYWVMRLRPCCAAAYCSRAMVIY